MRVLIATGGECHLTGAFAAALKEFDPELTIAADAGLEYIWQLGMQPDILLGDMDSLGEEKLGEARAKGLMPRLFSSHKDQTDTELALSAALELAGPEAAIRVIGAGGGRTDHTYANLLLLSRYRHQAEFWDAYSRIRMIRGPKRLEVEKPCWMRADRAVYYSFLPFGTGISALSLQGFEYPLQGASLQADAVIGISNQLAPGCERGVVTLESGLLLCMASQEA